jgi:glycosyltransferase involved in cell wall biosynthesis
MGVTRSNDRPPILFINHAAVIAGAEYALMQLAIAYRETSQVLLLADGPLRSVLESQGVTVKILAAPTTVMSVRTSSGVQSLKALPDLLKTAHQVAEISQNFDVIHANSQKAFIVASLARLMGGKPLTWHLHDILTASHFSPVNRKVAVFLANRFAAKMIAPSQAVVDAFVNVGGKTLRSQVIYNGISPARFEHISATQSEQVRAEIGISSDTPLVGLFSRLSPWKGQHVLLEAMKRLPPSAHALIVGAALFGEDDYAASIRERVQQDASLKQRVHLLGFRQDVPALMSACDILVHTSIEPEPCASVVIEGQLAHKPVIAAAAGGMFEVIQDGKTGRLVPPGDAVALANVIQSLLEHPLTANQLAQEGHQSARQKFSPDQYLQAFDQLFRTVALARY